MKLQVIVGGQFGSEAKGHIAGYLASQSVDPVVGVRVAGPNAGHSVVNPKTGVKHALRQIPVAAVTNPDAVLCIAAGSEIDLGVLNQELFDLEADGIDARDRLKVDPAATILTRTHVADEAAAALTERVGSTGKGIGAARAARLMREAETVADHQITINGMGAAMVPTTNMLRYMPSRSLVQVEGTQGFGLGLHTKFYPQVTSSDCRAIDFLSMAGISPWWFDGMEIWVVVRPHPIRVAGNSGPLRNETTWDALGLPTEYTTVTKKIRRVGTWDRGLVRKAIEENGGYRLVGGGPLDGPVRLALTMADQLDPVIAGKTAPEDITKNVGIFLNLIRADTEYKPVLVTTSDRTVIDLR